MRGAELEAFVRAAPLAEVFKAHPYARDFFSCVRLDRVDESLTLAELLGGIPNLYLDDFGLDRERLGRDFIDFMDAAEHSRAGASNRLGELAVGAGFDKSGLPEGKGFSARAGEVIAVVGMTGSGKSRLLADIECLAQGDTPTGRRVLVDGRSPSEEERFDLSGRLVAQLSQNMNFVMDATVADFLGLHARSRAVSDPERAAADILAAANELAGERFDPRCTLTQLSGGQSRALMIADVALLSDSPIVLIDELENAGIDRLRAIRLLVRREKIVLMSTHDPLLALLADRRVVIKNGGMAEVLETSEGERASLRAIEGMDERMASLRSVIRSGGRVEGIDMGEAAMSRREREVVYGNGVDA